MESEELKSVLIGGLEPLTVKSSTTTRRGPGASGNLQLGCARFDSHADPILDYLDFRDWLRAHPEDCDTSTKRQSANWSASIGDNMNYYAEAKSDVAPISGPRVGPVCEVRQECRREAS